MASQPNAHAKFLFDTDFGAAPKRPEPVAAEPDAPMVPSITLAEHHALLQAAEQAALERGRQEGRLGAEADDAARLAAAMQGVAAGIGCAATRLDAMAAQAEADGARLALALAKKLAGSLLARFPQAEIEALARSLFGHLRATPHVVVRVNEALTGPIKPRLDAIAHECGFAGRIVVLGEPDIQPGDVRIEWADGGVVRDRAALDAVLERSVRLYLDIAGERRTDERTPA